MAASGSNVPKRLEPENAPTSDGAYGQATSRNVREANSLWTGSADSGINMETGWSGKTKFTGKFQDKGQR